MYNRCSKSDLTLHDFCGAMHQMGYQIKRQVIIAFDWNQDPCDQTSHTKRLIAAPPTRLVLSVLQYEMLRYLYWDRV